MAVTILLIRHAVYAQMETTLTGRTPGLSLSDAGRAQAAQLGARLASAGIERIEAGPLERTMETAQAVAQGKPVTRVAALTELDLGDWTGRPFADMAGDPAWTLWNDKRGSARIPGGESMGEAQARIVAHLKAAVAHHDGETIAMVTHCDMIRAAVAWVLGLSLDHLLRFDIGPASVTRIVLGDWGGRVLNMNEGTH